MMILKNVLATCFCVSSLLCNAQLKKGQQAPSITLPNMQDSLVSLASFKGKVVVLDFWASWCGPCRRSNPQLVELYNEFKNQGLEVVSVSVDDNKKAWLQAVKQDGLQHTQLIEQPATGSKVATMYGIYQIPTLYIIDKRGRLQEKDLHGKELKNKVKELLKEE